MKKLTALALAAVLGAGMLLTACSNTNDPASTPPADDPPAPPPAATVEDKEIENGDILALSIDRLENADLSFDFTITLDGDTKESSLSAPQRAASRAAKTHTTDGKNYEIDYNSYIKEMEQYGLDNGGFFKNYNSSLASMSEIVRQQVDWVIEHITVMDTAVVMDSRYYCYLHYDSEKDRVSVLIYDFRPDKDALQNYQEISVYYDEEGDETVEVWEKHSMSGEDGATISHIVYTADKNFVIEKMNHTSQDLSAYVDVCTAFKQNGRWQGFHVSFKEDNTFLTKQGTYDYANGLLYDEFLMEEDNRLFRISDVIYPYRNGGQVYTEAAQDDDEFAIEQYGLYTQYSTMWSYCNQYSMNMELLTGWDRVNFTLSDEEAAKDFLQAPFTEDDSITLSNGTEIHMGDVWAPEKGWIRVEDGDYKDSEGTIYTFEELTALGGVRISDCPFYIENENKIFRNGFFQTDFDFSDIPKSSAELKAMFDANGLNFRGDNTGLFDSIAEVQKNKKKYADEVFEYLFGMEYNEENYIAADKLYSKKLKDFSAGCEEKVKAYDAMNMSDMPARPKDMKLVGLKKGLEGSAALSETGLDFTGVTANVGKTVILSTGKDYGIFVGWGSGVGTYPVAAFDMATYATADMSYTGKSCENVKCKTEGEFVFKMFFGRKDDKGVWIRLSELLDVPVAQFTEYSYNVDAAAKGGYYRNTVKYESGAAKLICEFVDTQGPVISVKGEAVSGATAAATFDTDGVVGDLITAVTAKDNADGDITVTIDNIAHGQDTLGADTPLEAGDYVVTVSDRSGNKTAVTVSVTLAAQE